jgi:uncharacterized membrane protein
MNSLIFEAAKPEFSMGLDIVLLVVPLVLAMWLFTRDHRRGPFWWPGLALFVLFLPNAPYAFTDILHLVFKIRKLPYLPVWAIALIVIPEYILYIGAGLQSYTISLMLLRRYLTRRGQGRLFLPMELSLHALSALGIFLGRRLRLNSWDMLRDPGRVLDDTLDAFDVQGTTTFVVVVFFVLLIIYRILAALNECILLAWRQRSARLQPADGQFHDRSSERGGHQHHHHHPSRHHDH